MQTQPKELEKLCITEIPIKIITQFQSKLNP